MIKIGIDLSTTNIGVSIHDVNDSKNIETFYIKLLPFNDTNLIGNCRILLHLTERIIRICDRFDKLTIRRLVVGIELSNFRNAKFTNRYSLYAGMLISHFSGLYFDVEFKMFNCSQWHKLIGCSNKDPRDVCKYKAKQYAIKNGNLPTNLSEDEYDAWCIAHLLECLETTEQTRERVKKGVKVSNLTKSKIIKLNKMKIDRLNKINKLDKIKNAKKIAKLEREICQINYETENLKKGGKHE